MRPEHADDVLRIYAEGIATGDATLETSAPTWEAFNAAHHPFARIVAVDATGRVLGWAALSPYSSRRTYHGVAWESVYIAEVARGRGVGLALLRSVVAESDANGIWTLLAGVLAENIASLRVHRRAGFRRVGVNRSIARDGSGRWRDVVQLERHSKHLAS